jgi:acyl-homoserine-lactone acylase
MKPQRAALLVVACFVVVACSGGDDTNTTEAPSTSSTAVESPDHRYEATIRRTSDGVPHILATDLKGVFFGQGYASGEDHACSLADQMLKITSTRAAALGAGENDANVNSDFAWKAIGINELARADYAIAPADIVEQFEAFAAGWNAHLDAVGVDGLTGWCAGTEWVRPVTGEDIYAYARSIALNASSSRLAQYIATAAPPGATAQPASFEAPPLPATPMASNGWAIGRDLVEGGQGGVLVANPHFPWEGELRFWEVQLTVPGELDIYGANLTGVPGIGIGFTDTFAWTHTVSAGNRFTAYTLTLDPSDPTTYFVDGEPVPMTPREFKIDVRGDDGTLSPSVRTLWFSEYGPILDFPGIGWSNSTVVTYRDANINNDEFIEQYAAMDRAKSLDEFIAAHEKFQGVPLFNTIAVSNDGRAWYADVSATPNLSDEAEAEYVAQVAAGGIAALGRQNGAVVLDGSKSINRWEEQEGARDPGLVPWSELPMTERTDYVFNANDSFWIANGSEPLSGDYSILHGEQNTARSLRTRENIRILGGSDFSGADGLFSGEELRDASVANTSYAAHLLQRALVERCTGATTIASPAINNSDGSVAVAAADVDISLACATLATWSGTYDLDAPGAPLFREWLSRVSALGLWSTLWLEQFDPARPNDTPNGIAPATQIAPVAGSTADPVLVALAQAVKVLEAGGRDVDVTLRDTQYAPRASTRMPVHGGLGSDGVTNVVSWGGLGSSTETVPTRGARVAPGSTLTADGYPINYGTSFLMTVDFTQGAPRAWAFLTYSNTGDRTSPLFDAQLKRFSEKDWREVLFTDEQIAADSGLVETPVFGD